MRVSVLCCLDLRVVPMSRNTWWNMLVLAGVHRPAQVIYVYDFLSAMLTRIFVRASQISSATAADSADRFNVHLANVALLAAFAASHLATFNRVPWFSITSIRARSSFASLNGPRALRIAFAAFSRTDGSFVASSKLRSVSTASVAADVSLPTASAVNCVRISETRLLNSAVPASV